MYDGSHVAWYVGVDAVSVLVIGALSAFKGSL